MAAEDPVGENQSRRVKAELSRWKCRKTSLDLNLGLAKPVYSPLSLFLFRPSFHRGFLLSRVGPFCRWSFADRTPFTFPVFLLLLFSRGENLPVVHGFNESSCRPPLLSQWRKTSAAWSTSWFSHRERNFFFFIEKKDGIFTIRYYSALVRFYSIVFLFVSFFIITILSIVICFFSQSNLYFWRFDLFPRYLN